MGSVSNTNFNGEVDIHNYLKSFVGQKVFYLPNPGNAGDNLITCGTHHVMREVGLDYTASRPDPSCLKGKIVFYGGGGNLICEDRYSYSTIKALHKDAGQFIILPHTIKEVDSLVKSFGSNVTVICRENVTYEYVNSIARGCKVLLSHDMALHLDVRHLLNEVLYFPRISIAAAALRARLLGEAHTAPANILALLSGKPIAQVTRWGVGQTRLNCFRTDDEKTDIALPSDNIDLPRVLALGNSPYVLAAHVARIFLSTINRFDEVNTNRLHVAIGAAMLGKKVNLHTNNYYKIRAVYEYSMKKRFDNISWIE